MSHIAIIRIGARNLVIMFPSSHALRRPDSLNNSKVMVATMYIPLTKYPAVIIAFNIVLYGTLGRYFSTRKLYATDVSIKVAMMATRLSIDTQCIQNTQVEIRMKKQKGRMICHT